MAPLATRTCSDDTSNDGASGGTPHGANSGLATTVGVIAVVAIAYLFFVFKVRRAPKTSGSTVSPGAPSDTVAHARLTPAAKPPAGGTVQMTEADAALVHALRKADIYFGGLQVAAPKPPKPAFHPSVAVSTRAKA